MSILAQFKRRFFKKNTDDNATSGSDTFVRVESPVIPKVVRHIGRRIAFHFDIDSVQMAAVDHTALNKTNLIALNTAYISKDASDDEREQLFIKEVNSFLDKFAGKRSDISIVLSGQEVACRTIIMPELKQRDLDSAIRFEATRKLPFPADQCVTEWRATRKITSSPTECKIQVSLLAATAKAIMSPLNYVEQKQVKVRHMYHAHDVIGQLLPYFEDFDTERPYALLWIGRHISEISFYHGSGLEFTQAVPVGTAQIDSGPEDDQFIRFATTLGDEVQTALDYYAGQYSSSFNDAICVYGEFAYSDELIEHLPQQTGFKFRRFPIERVPMIRNQPEEIINKSLLCLPVIATSVCRSELPNLLPAANKETLLVRKIDLVGRFVIALILISLLASWAFMNQSISTRRGIETSLVRQVEDFRSSEAYHQYNQLKASVATARSYMSKIKEEPSYLSLNLKELSKLTPKQIRISRYNLHQFDASNLTIHGEVVSKDIPPEVILAEYVENLNASSFYDKVNIRRHVKRKKDGEFTINFEIEMAGVL